MEKVPMIIYENEMRSRNVLIKFLCALLGLFIVGFVFTIYLFMSFINSYDYTDYSQNGDINSINSGTQGDIVNGAKTTNSN